MSTDTYPIVIVISVVVLVGGGIIGLVWLAMHLSEHGLWRD